MYKTLLHFSTLLLSIAILFAIYILIYFSNQNNTILVEPNEYIKILEQVHNDPDKYIGKKFIISGYVYIQDDFLDDRFVIAQDAYINELSVTEPFIVGFLCENRSGVEIYPNENIKIRGVLDKVIYNALEYPILLVDKITSLN